MLPAEIPVTKPVDEFIVATAVAELLHNPPLVVDDHVAEAPGHKGVVPVMVWLAGQGGFMYITAQLPVLKS